MEYVSFCSLDMQVDDAVKKINDLDALAATCKREACKQLMENHLLALSVI